MPTKGRPRGPGGNGGKVLLRVFDLVNFHAQREMRSTAAERVKNTRVEPSVRPLVMMLHHRDIDDDSDMIRSCTELVKVGVMVICVWSGMEKTRKYWSSEFFFSSFFLG